MSDDRELRRFAEALIRLVRDSAIEVCDDLLAGHERGPRGERWRALAADPAIRDALASVIPDVVDQVLFEFLDAVDNQKLPLAWQREDGSCVPLHDLGQEEMAGWLAAGQGGWLDSFSRHRFSDYASAALRDLPDEPGGP